ncbi:MAG: BLUF domain-containing protein [Opitutales bacterium]|nr:BLUF domain-containing protein [Opitutales bacterium]
MEDILSKAKEHNKEKGIFGMLILTGDQFLQILEGPVRYVNQLYSKILQDERHKDVELISYVLITTPYFYDWSMRLLNLDEVDDELRHRLMKKYPHQEYQLVIPEEKILLYSLIHDARDLF